MSKITKRILAKHIQIIFTLAMIGTLSQTICLSVYRFAIFKDVLPQWTVPFLQFKRYAAFFVVCFFLHFIPFVNRVVSYFDCCSNPTANHCSCRHSLVLVYSLASFRCWIVSLVANLGFQNQEEYAYKEASLSNSKEVFLLLCDSVGLFADL
jgi:hypothetical protein